MPSLRLFSRQAGGDTDGTSNLDVTGWQWYAIKWAILIGILVVLLALFVLGYAHARRRMQKGLPLLSYHRWLVPRGMRMRYEAGMNGNRTHSAWPMNRYNYAAPPPPGMEVPSAIKTWFANFNTAYNPEHDYVPAYSPPPPGFNNFSKVDPDQRQNMTRVNEQEVIGAMAGSSSQNAEVYTAPSGPPPNK